ncbi:MAG: OmpA family protein, partial [Flavobacteriales bacterium]|nr:OmpA family protein [Flavobacteriales bacterium]MDW8411016.1 OmpA family protein [Flavobacteriales bacterium]
KMRPSDLSVGFSAREPQVNPDTAFFIWDKTRWYTIEGKFRAEGGERYVVLGYFGKKKDPPLIYLRDRRTEGLLPECYYLIDDVYLGLEPPPERNHTRPAPRPVDYVPFRRGFQWIEGTVTDRLTGNPLPGAEVLVYELGHPEKAERVQLTRQGSFRVAVPRGKYVIVGRHKGYLPRALYSESTVYEESLEIKLTEVKKGHKMPLLNFYTYQDGALRFHRFAPEELREVASYLADHPNVKIQVNSQGYRQRGKQESEEDVMYETEARSKEIMDFLVEAGALGYQVAARGYGLSRGAGYLDEIEITDILPLPDNRPRFPLTVVLRNAQTQKIVPGTFNLVHQERGTVRVVENPEGRVTVKIHPGTYLLSVAAPGYLPVVENVAMPLDAHEVTILLHPIENNSFTLRNISFPPNSFSPDSSSYPILDQVAELLRQRPDISLSIEGHTDGSNERTTDEYLNELSLRRAEGVKAYLVAKGIDPARLQCIGYGRSKPVASNDTPEGRALNRRIEFRIIE